MIQSHLLHIFIISWKLSAATALLQVEESMNVYKYTHTAIRIYEKN